MRIHNSRLLTSNIIFESFLPAQEVASANTLYARACVHHRMLKTLLSLIKNYFFDLLKFLAGAYILSIHCLASALTANARIASIKISNVIHFGAEFSNFLLFCLDEVNAI